MQQNQSLQNQPPNPAAPPAPPTGSILQRQSSILKKNSPLPGTQPPNGSSNFSTNLQKNPDPPNPPSSAALLPKNREGEGKLSGPLSLGGPAQPQSGRPVEEGGVPARSANAAPIGGNPNAAQPAPSAMAAGGAAGGPAGQDGKPGIARQGSFQGTDPTQRRGSMQRSVVGDSSFQRQGSFQGGGGGGSTYGSMYGMPSSLNANPYPDSAYGGGFGSMGPGGMGDGSMYGGGAGSAAGSFYGGGAGAGSMGPGGMNSLYGSMGPGGMAPMEDPRSQIAAQWASLSNMSRMNGGSVYGGSMYGGGGANGLSVYGGSFYGNGTAGGSFYGGNTSGGSMYGQMEHRHNINDLMPNLGTLDDHVPLKRSGKRGGKSLTVATEADGKTPKAADTKVSTLLVRKASFAKDESSSPSTTTAANGSTAKAKLPANYNIHSLVVVDQGGSSTRKSSLSIKDPKTLVLKRDDGKEESFENDESLTRKRKTDVVDSVLLNDLQANWIAGHTTALLVGGGKDRGDDSVDFAQQVLTQLMKKLESNQREKSIYFDVTITMGVIESSDRIRDLLNPDNENYERMQLGSSPAFGPCLCGMKTKTVKSERECRKVFDNAVKLVDNEKHMIVAFFVLKQVKKSSQEKDVYLSSLCVGIAKEDLSHFTGLKEKSKSEPCTLFRYAVGGGSVTVCAVLVSEHDSEIRGALEVARKMRQVKNSPPRSGNVKSFVELTNKEVSRQREKLSKLGDNEKGPITKVINRMDTMIKDGEEMLSNPEETEPKGYSMSG